jgi:predicted site-specific integrase-resolvase
MKPIKPKDAAEMLNVTVNTLQKWDRLGILVAHRLKTNRRYYLEEQINDFLGKESVANDCTVIYVRVSNYGQSDDLKNQIQFLQDYAKNNGYVVNEIIKDIGSGLNYERKKWNKLLERIHAGEITRVVVAHRDRFIRFGFEWFEEYLQRNGCELVVINQQVTSPQEEMIQDLISIIHVFSCRIYGLRKYKDKIRNDTELPSDGNREGDLFCEPLNDCPTN